MTKLDHYSSAAVLKAFHIRESRNHSALDQWLGATGTLSVTDHTILDAAIARYWQNYRGWNEEELKMHFISAIFFITDVNIPDVCKMFFERPLSGTLEDYEISLVSDCMVAGYDAAGDPVKPYFFLQEFKRRQTDGKHGDPEGQMLSAMLLAYDKNKDEKPVYGSFVIGPNWQFATLQGKDYAVSRQYDASRKEDVVQIVYILRKLKQFGPA